ncbi:MAG: nuclear transport factor 2 family protein, partial [Gammaproteobacteria bacterium]
DELVSDYTEDSVILFESSLITGLDNIRAFFDDFVTNTLPPGCEFEMKHMQVVGHMAYIVWAAGTDKLSFKLGTDTFFVSDGKIAQQTIAAHVEPKG